MAAEIETIDAALEQALPHESVAPQTLHRAMRYSVFAGGKRLRPLLCRAAARAVAGRDCDEALPVACALEMIHTYSLIHDDLPALDNDDLRRGRPTCHKVFGEAMAILAGDALLTRAFGQLAQVRPPERVAALVAELSAAAGSPRGMVGGQVADLEGERATATAESVRFIHQSKTAALIRASVVLGAIVAGATESQRHQMARFGEAIGLAFQIVDDILDVTGDAATLGKSVGKDEAQKKATWPAVFGLEAAQREAHTLVETALAELASLGGAADRLRLLAGKMVERKA
jgi:geranylgeranyl diphosphate synthase type II